MFKQKLGDILVDLGKIFIGGMVIGGIMSETPRDLCLIVSGLVISFVLLIVGLILQTAKK